MDHKDLCNHTRIKLIASAVGHQQCTKTEANIIPLPGGERVIAIGTPAEVCGLLADAPLTAPAPLTTSETDMLELAHLFDDARESDKPLTLSAESCAALHAAMTLRPAAPAPQQSELTDERIEAIWNSIDGKAVITGENQMNWNSALRRAFACAIERELAKAAPAAPVQRIPDMLTVETIQGAIAFGRMGINPPPSPDHWGNEFWQIGRQLAKLSETSAWDNVTPVDVAAPVQAEQAQAEPVNVAEMVNRFLGWKLPKDFSPDCGIIFDGRGPDARGYDRGWPTGTNLFHAGQAKEMFEHCLKGAVRPTDDDLWDQTLRERDHNADMADKLAEAIGKHFGIEIGEHSNMNCPWQTALDWIENESTHAEMQAAAAPAQAEQAAAVRAAYENAAQACEAWGNAKVAKWADYPEMSEDAKARAWDALQCAAAIRALAAPSTATSNDGGDRE
jgi:hypothetical protein